jgi:hypothetical protein
MLIIDCGVCRRRRNGGKEDNWIRGRKKKREEKVI